jgi:hypothetical protein
VCGNPPRLPSADHHVHDGEKLSRAGDQRELLRLSGGDESLVECLDHGIALGRHESCHVERGADARSDSLVRKLFTAHVVEEKGGSSFYGWGPYYAELRRYPSTGVVAILLTNERGTAVDEIWNTALRLVAQSAPPSS